MLNWDDFDAKDKESFNSSKKSDYSLNLDALQKSIEKVGKVQ